MWPDPSYLKRDCVDIAYWTFGEGKPLVLITGLATPASSWGPFPLMLSQQGYKVIVIDNRDAGLSSRCDGLEYAVPDMADDIAAVISELDAAPAYVLGISMGGMIAQELALNHPDKVERLMLMSTDPGPPDRVVDEAWWMDFLSTPASDPKEYMRLLIEKMTAPGWAERNAETVGWMVDARTSQMVDLAAFQRQFNATLSHSTGSRLPSLKMPVMILHGDQDRMVCYANGQRLAELIPGAEFVTVPGSGHLVPVEAVSEVVSAIARFFPVTSAAEVG